MGKYVRNFKFAPKRVLVLAFEIPEDREGGKKSKLQLVCQGSSYGVLVT